ncbi:hypothetical protein [Streptomyces sp. B3I8]|uniref:hypothetical protein n=1 Tax=Streptomyces sp. B3I8 TaxID=3042303 RepID=UPI00278B197E|nr:hypothetical protein [Streptomyces sp. B3I8]MDQ0790785.1 AcrR family transcriptional regulator [Streptomyces sp. B3I8]
MATAADLSVPGLHHHYISKQSLLRAIWRFAMNDLWEREGGGRAEHIAARSRQQRLMDALPEEGAANGLFSTPSPREVSRAVVRMCTGVSQWYRPGGELSPAHLAEQYRVVARMTVGAPATT